MRTSIAILKKIGLKKAVVYVVPKAGEILTFGKEKWDYLRRFSPFKYGIPSKNTFARALSALDPTMFKSCFIVWVQSFQLALKKVFAKNTSLKDWQKKAG